MTNEESLARIPFSAEIEKRILNQAFWMNFVAIILYIAAIGCAVGLVGVFMIKVSLPISTSIVAAGLLILVGLFAYQGYSLNDASHYFKLVARKDEADQEYVAEGFEKIKVFFMIEGFFMVLAFIAGLFSLSVGIL
ncbi:MAG: hypothetical protein HOD85_05660 [Deltaproteobacteria bacterium]|nr:hypothetical protein [Deltaproteobacteria bacterium]